MKEIILNTGARALVDDDEYAALSVYRWSLDDKGYAARQEQKNGRKITVLMHRAIMNFPVGFDVDHIDGNRINNQKSNLRPVTKQQNQFNRGAINGSTSPHKGVSWSARHKLWRANIRIDKKNTHLGLFRTEIEAAGAYNAVAAQIHGEYARLNNVPTLLNWESLRACTPKGPSGYRGVHACRDKWRATIRENGKKRHIGVYDTPESAARAYNEIALELYGARAFLNKLPEAR